MNGKCGGIEWIHNNSVRTKSTVVVKIVRNERAINVARSRFR